MPWSVRLSFSTAQFRPTADSKGEQAHTAWGFPRLCGYHYGLVLRMFVSTLRTPGLTYRRPNRRLPALVGQVPGRSRYAQREKPTLLTAIDTSGSMTHSALSEIARQLRLLGRLAKITVVECDATIQRVYTFPGALDAVAGRGGTDFRPVFDPEFLATHRPDGIVWFTDGCGPYPDEPSRVRTLWVLTSSSPPFTCPWGKKIIMKEQTEEPGSSVCSQNQPGM